MRKVVCTHCGLDYNVQHCCKDGTVMPGSTVIWEPPGDTKLIAAAPAMLYALKVSVQRLKEIQYQKASPKQIAYLEEVIAKAEGRE
jgi:hypothetical protein